MFQQQQRRRLQQFLCTFCSKSFRDRGKRNFHLRALHGVGKKPVCPYCDRQNFKSKTTFYNHKRTCKSAHDIVEALLLQDDTAAAAVAVAVVTSDDEVTMVSRDTSAVTSAPAFVSVDMTVDEISETE